MVKIPDKHALGQPKWYSPRKVASFDGSAFAAPGRAVQQLGGSIAKLGKSLGGAIDAQAAEQDAVHRNEIANQFLDLDLKMNDYYANQERNMAPDGEGFRTDITDTFDRNAREFFKGVPEKYRQEYDTKLRRRHMDYELRARDRELKQRDDYHTREVGTALDGFLKGIEDDPDSLKDQIGRGIFKIENSRLPQTRKEELIRKFGESAEERHIQYRIQTGKEDPEDIRKDILQRVRPMWEPKAGPRSEGPAGPGQAMGTAGLPNIGVDKDFSKGRGFGELKGVKQGILHDVSGPDRAKRVLPDAQNISQYHITFDGDGVYMNVPLDRKAPHAADMNADTIGIARIGYEGEKLSPQEIDNGARALLFASEKTGLSLDQFSTHPSAGPAATRSAGGKDPREASWRDEVVARAKEIQGAQGGGTVAAAGVGHNGGPAGSLPSSPGDYLVSRLAKGYEKRTADVTGLHPVTQDRLAAFIAAGQEAGHDISIVSGYRSVERQRVLWNNALKKYGSAAAARKWVAPPGGSSHQSGEAVDIQYGDRKPGLGGTRTEAVKWAHANAEKFGLTFPLGHEDWHIEPIEARQGGKRYGGKYAEDGKRYWQGGGQGTQAASVSASTQPSTGSSEGLKVNLTAYSPQRGASNSDGGQGNYLSSRPGPDGKNEVRTLADVQAGRSQYVTIAGNPRDYGKEYTIPEVSFYDRDGKKHTLRNVRAVVHDTGSAFKNAPEGRFDLPIDRDAGQTWRNKSHALWKEAGLQFIPGAPGQDQGTQTAEAPPPVSERGLTQWAGLSYGPGKGTQVADASGQIGSPSQPETPPTKDQIRDRIQGRLSSAPGMVEPGNIDLNTRPPIGNEDGSVSTIISFSVNIDGKEVLLPSIIDGKRVNEKQAIEHYRKTGEHLGKFESPEAATAYAKVLSQRQDGTYAKGLARIDGQGRIHTLLDGIPDNTPLSALPADTRAEIEKMAPKDAFKPVNVMGNKVAAADTITVGDLKAGLESGLHGEAKATVAQTAAGDVVAENTQGLEGRTPKYSYRWITQGTADKLLRELSIAQRNAIKNETDGLVGKIKRFGTDGLEDAEAKILERAERYMTPNQVEAVRIKLGKAKAFHQAISELPGMPEDRINSYLQGLNDKWRLNTDPEQNAALEEASQAAETAASKIREQRRKDPALAVESLPEVQQALQRIAQARSQSGYLGTGQGGAITRGIDEQSDLTPAQVWEILIDGRIEAQERIFGDRNDPRIKRLTREEAVKLLGFDNYRALTEEEMFVRLQEGAKKADRMFGTHAAEAFADAVQMLVKSGTGLEDAPGIAKKIITGEPISATEFYRYQMGRDMSPSDAFARTTVDNVQIPVPNVMMSNGLRPTGGAPVPAQGGRPALMQGGPQMQGVQTQGQSVQMQTPNRAAVEWLLSDPGRNRAAFDAKFGKQATDYILEEAQRRMQQGPAPGAPMPMDRGNRPSNWLFDMLGGGKAQ